jgi:response regulator RpfG family c-di-GMP phosphodiesterase
MIDNEYNKLLSVINLNLELSKIKDYDILLETILTQARKLMNANAGTIYLIENDKLKFKYSQNDSIKNFKKSLSKIPYKITIDKNSLAGFVALTGDILNIPDVYNISKDKSYYFNKHIDELISYRTKSVLTVPLKSIKNEVIGVFQLINKFDDEQEVIPFSEKEIPLVYHFASLAASTLERAQLTRDILLRMIRMAELRDPKETGAHVNRVASFALLIYEQYALKNKIPKSVINSQKDILRLATMLHDVGKISIPDTILKKKASLTDDEYAKMKLHTIIGAKLFLPFTSELDKACFDIALNHHEKWDGTGYPGHIDLEIIAGNDIIDITNLIPKKGKEIPLFGRITALADVYDALASKRSYKEKWEEKRILDLLKNESGHHFDPELIEIFFEIYDNILEIKAKYE